MLNVKKIKVKKKIQDKIENLLLNDYFDWYYNPSTSYDALHKNMPDTFQFTHTFINDETKKQSGALPYVLELFNEFKLGKYKKFDRIKANFTTNNIKMKGHQHIHYDYPRKGMKSLLYYVNDSDGDTIFFDNKKNEIGRVKPKRGLGLLFDSNIYHAGCNPVNSDKRIVINFIYYD